jgi:hypothetical protein
LKLFTVAEALLSKSSSDEGTTIHVNPAPENARASIRTNFDIGSNVTGNSDLQREKQHSLRVSIVCGSLHQLNPSQSEAIHSQNSLLRFQKQFNGMDSTGEGIHRQ